MATYSPSRLRRVVDQRDAARASLKTANTRLEETKLGFRSAERALQDFERSRVDIRSERDIAKFDADLTRLSKAVEEASELLAAANRSRDEAAEIVSVTASLAHSGIEFAAAAGWLPNDIRERC